MRIPKSKLRLALALVPAVAAAVYGSTELLGSRRRTVAGQTCEEHRLRRCPFCLPSLLASMGFCREHEVPEAICTRCRGDLEPAFRAARDWCEEHGLPESQCEACNPGALERFRKDPRATAAPPGSPRDIEIVQTDVPRFRREPSLTCANERSIVRFASADVTARAGLEFAEVRAAPLRRTLSAPAELTYDATRHALLAPRASGSVLEVRRELGARVTAGEALIVVHSAALGEAKSELLRAEAHVQLWEKNHDRERRLLGNSLTTEKAVLEAEARLAESRISLTAAEHRLRNFGLDDSQIREVRETGESSALLELAAPFPGVVVDLRAVVGQIADSASPLVAVADTTRLWAIAHVGQADIEDVSVGQPVLLTFDGLRDETFGGRVTWISSAIDPRTRTVLVRAELHNEEGRLRAGAFGHARIVTREDEAAVLVPKDAVQWEGCCNVAFVRRSDTEFVPRRLRLGYDAGDFYEVLSGLGGGEQVVTVGSFLLKTELQKGSIGAGCCEVDHLGR